MYKSPTVGHRTAVTQNRDTETPLHEISFENTMRSGARLTKPKHKPSTLQTRIKAYTNHDILPLVAKKNLWTQI